MNNSIPFTSPIQPASMPTIPSTEDNDETKALKRNRLIIHTKNFLGRTLSLGMMLYGFNGLVQEIYKIFFEFPQLSKQANFQDVNGIMYQDLWTTALIISITSIINSTYGLMLLIKHGKSMKIAYFITGMLIIFLTYLINNRYLDLNYLLIQMGL